MIEIKHKETGEVLLQIEADDPTKRSFDSVRLPGADFSGMDMEKVDEVEAEHDDEDAQKSRQISHKDVL